MVRSTLPLMGRELIMERANERDAMATTRRAEIYDYTLVAAPDRYDASWRRSNLRYRIELARQDVGLGLPKVEQTWHALGNGRFDLDVVASAVASGRRPMSTVIGEALTPLRAASAATTPFQIPIAF